MYSVGKIRAFIPQSPILVCTSMKCPYPAEVQSTPYLTQECILEPVPIVPDTPVDSATLYLHRIRSSSSSSVVLSSFQLCSGFAHSPQGSSINLNVQHFTLSTINRFLNYCR